MNFLDIRSLKDICKIFDIKEVELLYIIENISSLYVTFAISKKNGSTRVIDSPRNTLLKIQQKLNAEIKSVYKPKKPVHAYSIGRSIVTNATRHKKSKFLLNIDLRDFFHSITYNRVNGLFKSYPFYFNDEVSRVLSLICCYKSRLPQGSPVSPIISNLICRSLDTQLISTCREQKCSYTRYADDITISCNTKNFPSLFGNIISEEFVLSDTFIKIFKRQNFAINLDKVRFQTADVRQVVTGLTVNDKINVSRLYLKKVRAILHAIEEFGPQKAMERFFELNNLTYDGNNDYTKRLEYFLKKISGKISFIGFVKGKDNPTYIRLYERITKIYPEANLSVIYKEIADSEYPIVITEGKTDWKHIKAAQVYFASEKGKFQNLKFSLRSYENELQMGDDNLYKFCLHQSKAIIEHKQKIICVFDRDVPAIVNKVTSINERFKSWGNSIYSMVIPVPVFRTFNQISIEQLYEDSDLTKYDKNRRRLFLSTEFNSETAEHLVDENIILTVPKLAKNKTPKIIDHSVRLKGESIAMSKNDFAENILGMKSPFDKMNFDGFEALFENIQNILSLSEK